MNSVDDEGDRNGLHSINGDSNAVTSLLEVGCIQPAEISVQQLCVFWSAYVGTRLKLNRNVGSTQPIVGSLPQGYLDLIVCEAVLT